MAADLLVDLLRHLDREGLSVPVPVEVQLPEMADVLDTVAVPVAVKVITPAA